jgi:hypothetical protein
MMGHISSDQLLYHREYDPSAPMAVKQAGIEERDGLAIYDTSFSSPVNERSKAVGPNGATVTAYLIVPPGQEGCPAVIFGHWCMPGSEKKNRTEFLDEASAFIAAKSRSCFVARSSRTGGTATVRGFLGRNIACGRRQLPKHRLRAVRPPYGVLCAGGIESSCANARLARNTSRPV